jgi:ATP phosphoribosyltransferase
LYSGEDIIAETGVSVQKEMQLGFGKCRLSLLVPEINKDARPADYAGHRIVTSFPEVRT